MRMSKRKSFKKRIKAWDEIQIETRRYLNSVSSTITRMDIDIQHLEQKLQDLSEHVDIYAKQIAELTEQVETLEHHNG